MSVEYSPLFLLEFIDFIEPFEILIEIDLSVTLEFGHSFHTVAPDHGPCFIHVFHRDGEIVDLKTPVYECKSLLPGKS